MNGREGSVEWLDLEHYSDTPMFNTKAVVQQTGVPAPTLRAWERRYTLIAPVRGENAYRLYSERHIVLICWLKDRIDSGMSISQAIALFRHINQEQQKYNSGPLQDTTDETHLEASSSFHIVGPPSEASIEFGEQADTLQSLQEWPGSEPVQQGYPIVHNMTVTRERLIETFLNFDEPMAHMIMGTMLSIYSVEQICTSLIAPTMFQVGQLWAEKRLSVSEEHFASNFFRALLTNLFHVTPGPLSGPYALVCCAPGEAHEMGALMLALFLRRRGVRVVYLGQSIETASLLRTIRQRMPALVCVSLTMPAYFPAFISLSRQIQAMPQPRPIFAFGGLFFSQSLYTDMGVQIPGICMNGDLGAHADHLRALLLERSENKN
ncbi:MAG TPA: cobalamin-dependent protein [Ktedonobacteraceae bacterium]|jgi:DNA-binding transcriptional MerR regulator